jgi:hypothetical protein
MLEGNLALNLEQTPDDEPTVDARPQATLGTLPKEARAEEAANETGGRRKRRMRGIIWDDGGLKPFRLG